MPVRRQCRNSKEWEAFKASIFPCKVGQDSCTPEPSTMYPLPVMRLTSGLSPSTAPKIQTLNLEF